MVYERQPGKWPYLVMPAYCPHCGSRDGYRIDWDFTRPLTELPINTTCVVCGLEVEPFRFKGETKGETLTEKDLESLSKSLAEDPGIGLISGSANLTLARSEGFEPPTPGSEDQLGE